MLCRTFLLGTVLGIVGVGPLPAQRMKLLVPLDSLVAKAARDSNDAPAHYEAALGFWVSNQYDEAERHLRQAIAIEPRTAQAYLALSYLPFARRPKLWDEIPKGKVPAELIDVVNEAYRFRRRAYLIDPMVDLKPLALMIPSTGTFGLGKSATRVYTYVMNGFGSFWDGQYAKAFSFLTEIAGDANEEDRKKFATWFLWYEGLAAAHIGEQARAIADFRLLLDRAVARESTDSSAIVPLGQANEVRYTLAVILDNAGRTEEAVRLLQESLENDLGLYPAHSRLAVILEEKHQYDRAVEERQRAVAADPENPSLLLDLGSTLIKASQPEAAGSALQQAIDANPRNARPYYLLGHVAEQLGAKDQAENAYTRFIELAPSRFSTQIAEVRTRLAALH
ncbi:MAG: tetratricopeptide repeat protein [Gemmatimonadales bacterium]